MKKTLLLFLWITLASVYSFANENTINTLLELKKSQNILHEEIKNKTALIKQSVQDDEKERLKQEIKALDLQANEFQTKFEKIATGIDTSLIKEKEDTQVSSLSEDFQLLIKPLLHGAKQATEDMRKKAKLNEELQHYKTILSQANKARQNIAVLLEDKNSTTVKEELFELAKHWDQRVALITSNLNATQQHIEMMEKDDVSFSHSFKNSLQNFFQQQGLVLIEGIGAFLVVIIVMQMIHIIFVKMFPILLKPSRTFFIRFMDLLYWLITTILAVFAPMTIFYYEKNWVLSSLGILILLGTVWTFRNLIPKLWQQARLLLNIGPVRQEERIYYQNLPWRVKNINIFTILENQDSGIKLRLPIEELVGLTSRPALPYEPWFPCRLKDWVLLSNEYYGKVVGISLEFVELTDTGGGHKTFVLSDFLSLSPLNLSTGFRIFSTIGISYRHQKESTRDIVAILETYISKQIEKEGYQEGLSKLLVQFSHAGNSSLDIAVVANFNGDMAPLYFRLRRAIERWCVDACTEYGWEIPFPQLTIHKPKG